MHRLAVALPKPGEYVHEIIVMKELPGAISCMLPDKSTLGLNLEDRFLAIRVKVHLMPPVPSAVSTATDSWHFFFGAGAHSFFICGEQFIYCVDRSLLQMRVFMLCWQCDLIFCAMLRTAEPQVTL